VLFCKTDVAYKAVISPDLTEHGLKEAFIDHYVGKHVMYVHCTFLQRDFVLYCCKVSVHLSVCHMPVFCGNA